MTNRLQKAFAEAAKRPVAEQNLLATRLLAELAVEDNLSANPSLNEAVSGNPTTALAFDVDGTPLRMDHGVLRVGNSRVSLDLIVEQFDNGVTPEEIVRSYDSLLLADVYSAIAFYLRHSKPVRAYVTQRAQYADSLQTGVETDRLPVSLTELLKRRSEIENDHAATGQ